MCNYISQLFFSARILSARIFLLSRGIVARQVHVCTKCFCRNCRGRFFQFIGYRRKRTRAAYLLKPSEFTIQIFLFTNSESNIPIIKSPKIKYSKISLNVNYSRYFKLVQIRRQVEKSSVLLRTYCAEAIIKPKVPQAGSLQSSPACALIHFTMTSSKGRGVKYCPAPDFFRWHFFRASLHTNCRDLLHVQNTNQANLWRK